MHSQNIGDPLSCHVKEGQLIHEHAHKNTHEIPEEKGFSHIADQNSQKQVLSKVCFEIKWGNYVVCTRML